MSTLLYFEYLPFLLNKARQLSMETHLLRDPVGSIVHKFIYPAACDVSQAIIILSLSSFTLKSFSGIYLFALSFPSKMAFRECL